MIKVLVGTSVNNVQIRYTLNPHAQEDFYSLTAGASSTILAPGVLANDELGAGSSLTAQLASGPSHGTSHSTVTAVLPTPRMRVLAG